MTEQQQERVGYLIFKRVKIQDANSISSPITYGFPAVSGFLGAFHAMSRRLQQHQLPEELNEVGLSLKGVLIACHDCQVKAYRQSDYSDYTFNQTRNPIKKDGSVASIIEEGKCNLLVTLVVEVFAENIWPLEDEQCQTQLVNLSRQWIQQQRLAGGSVLGLKSVEYIQAEAIGEISRHLLPAFVLMNAQQDLIELTQIQQHKNPTATALDALIDVVTLQHIPIEQQEKGKTVWQTVSPKSGRGWLVSMAIGFQGIADSVEAGKMQNSRNAEYSSQYVEAVYSLGKWVFPHRINDLNKAFWHYHHIAEQDLYLTIQNTQFDYINTFLKEQ
ncbi:type I-F CRISPR-associated protein Csy2 [Testudinibacter aquarius]|uniref:CRISPR-associated Csy2 family protein n=1 Tax=Testudinibacter aquarius TaxID=1524974 RepID=A0A4V2W2G4_9PAST|nr:type I-F CRISPR-associated protein Csy2 [Testudinibacter aquarius]KAE9530176.1 hypothetical protein A1D24_06815 [Testudinibacter aquarius]TCV87959.1 CRISPR-associated Csy2 family protein [Testudinibacter aquarius]TNG90237.1 type I-F CRISPR-associated protein Csy2 [Testudinibacter aquarius]